MKQIALPLSAASDNPPRIVVGNANAAVLDALADPASWPFHTLILTGPPRSGKSLLGRWFAASGGGDVVDDAEQADEHALFHQWNRAQETGVPLLLISNRKRGSGEGRWSVQLPDLGSRLGAAMELEIGEPDDEMLEGLLALHAEMRGLVLDQTATQYLAGRCERSHLGVERLIAAIDRLSLERKQPPTMAIWREALNETKGHETMGGGQDRKGGTDNAG